MGARLLCLLVKHDVLVTGWVHEKSEYILGLAIDTEHGDLPEPLQVLRRGGV